MRKITFSLLFMLLVSALNAQSIGHDLTIFAEEGEKFTLFINGQQINEQPQSSVSVKDIAVIPYIQKLFLKIAKLLL